MNRSRDDAITYLRTKLREADDAISDNSREKLYAKIDEYLSNLSIDKKNAVNGIIREWLSSRDGSDEIFALRLIYLLRNDSFISDLEQFRHYLYARRIHHDNIPPSIELVDNLIDFLENPSISDLTINSFNRRTQSSESTCKYEDNIPGSYLQQADDLLNPLLNKAGKLQEFSKDGTGMRIYIANKIMTMPHDEQIMAKRAILTWLQCTDDNRVGEALFLISRIGGEYFLPALKQLRDDSYKGKRYSRLLPTLQAVDNVIEHLESNPEDI